MKLNSESNILAENKILILYFLNKIDKAINSNDLFRLILPVKELNYFYFQQFLLDLINNKYIASYYQSDETLYEITTLGKNTLLLTQDILPGIIKFKVDNCLKESLNTINDMHSITSEYTPIDEKSYIVTCSLIDNGNTLLELKTFAGSRDTAKQISDNWEKNASEIYPKIINLLTSGNEK